jgi:divalent metal cation (Fe/Co/Zn/Cd) transporter
MFMKLKRVAQFIIGSLIFLLGLDILWETCRPILILGESFTRDTITMAFLALSTIIPMGIFTLRKSLEGSEDFMEESEVFNDVDVYKRRGKRAS